MTTKTTFKEANFSLALLPTRHHASQLFWTKFLAIAVLLAIASYTTRLSRCHTHLITQENTTLPSRAHLIHLLSTERTAYEPTMDYLFRPRDSTSTAAQELKTMTTLYLITVFELRADTQKYMFSIE